MFLRNTYFVLSKREFFFTSTYSLAFFPSALFVSSQFHFYHHHHHRSFVVVVMAKDTRRSDDDDDDEHESQIYLGYSGRMVSSREVDALDAFVTKVGGEPKWFFTQPMTATKKKVDDDDKNDGMESKTMLSDEQLRCKSCGGKLSLVFQAHAPLTRARDAIDEDILERTLYVFSCMNFASCETKKGGGGGNASMKWRAFRVQTKRTGGNEMRGEMNKLCNDEKSDDDDDAFRTNDDWGCAESKDDWGVSSKNNATTNHAEEEEESLEQLTKQLDEALLKEKERREELEFPEEEDDDDDEIAIESFHEDSPIALPEFYVCSDLEPTKAEAKRKAFGLAAGKIDSMLNKYAQEEGLEVSEIEKSLLALHAGGGKIAEMKDMMDESGTKEVSSSWQGETYEEGESINASAQYLKFQKRINRAPEQIARYCFRMRDCDVVWPDGDVPTRKSKPCEKCKGKREMELHLTPGLLKEIEDALRLRAKAGRKGGISETDAIAFDFNSVGVWTCVNSCFDASQEMCVREEEVFVTTDRIDQSVLAKLAVAIEN